MVLSMPCFRKLRCSEGHGLSVDCVVPSWGVGTHGGSTDSDEDEAEKIVLCRVKRLKLGMLWESAMGMLNAT
jgi:hypothetical protein